MAASRRTSNRTEGVSVPESNRSAENPSLDRERIARRASERFEQRGREHGRDMEDWLEAERELRDTGRGE